MATYNPAADLLVQQMESLVAQIHQNWICLVSDDASAPALFREVERLAERDSRFRVERNPVRLGPYRNFERCLERVPPEARYVAFCDQDDLWYPDKLSACLAEFRPETTLVYCDMHIVDRKGGHLADTYWTDRTNNYTDFPTLAFANTVTGAASVFRADLLNLVLPFPYPIGDAYHDHWIAMAALAQGRLGYVNRPLYAYRQHAANVVGHYTSEGHRLLPGLTSVRSALSSKAALKQAARLRMRLLVQGDRMAMRLAVRARTLQARLPAAADSSNGSVVARLAGIEKSVWPLVGEAVRSFVSSRATLGLELLFLRGVLGLRLARTYYALKKDRILAQALIEAARAPAPQPISAAPGPSTVGAAPGPPVLSAAVMGRNESLFLRQKTAPLKLEIRNDAPRRINVVTSQIDFRYLFAGYVSVFTLAQKLAAAGNRVRIVIVDECDYDPQAWRGQIVDYPGLEGLFDVVETSYHYDRGVSLRVSPKDAFVATSWWTAYVAHRAARQLGQERFTFLAQEFEPLFYNAGSRYSMSLAAYGFPHYAIFSTELLREYFRANRVGVFRSGVAVGDERSISISNAAHAFEVDAARLARRGPRRLLFYARPEAHAARNMFEIGLLALQQAVASGGLNASEWEFDGIGGNGEPESFPLGVGAHLRLRPRTSLREYMQLLPDYDMGLSLMLSPHPSMTPLDMAAAGLVTVTNTFANKTPERLTELSSNLVPVEPSVDAIAAGLAEGAARIGHLEARLAGSRIRWPTKWADTFNAEVMGKIEGFIAATTAGAAGMMPEVAGNRSAVASDVHRSEARQPPVPSAAPNVSAESLGTPPADLLKYVGAGSADDAVRVGAEFMGLFLRLGKLTPSSRVLDIGCGPGRMAIPLTRFLVDGTYEGFDLHAGCITWAQDEISSRFPSFQFHRADVRNGAYHPTGLYESRDYRFPYEDASFDFVFLASVFTHMLPEDMNHYLDEISRVLAPGGRCLATFFLMNEESKRLIREGRSKLPIAHDYGVYAVAEKDQPEAVIGFREDYALASIARAGLAVEPPIHYGYWCGRPSGQTLQDVIVGRKE
jgi:SAM-dependent methyltransferase/glycosyltransferase involved in cell wall biosynthesis